MRVPLSLAAMLLAVVAHAVPTGLMIIPTAEALGDGQARVEVRGPETALLYAPRAATVAGAQVGLAAWAEAGVDQLGDGGQALNVKLHWGGGKLYRPGAALDAENLPDVLVVVTPQDGPDGLQYRTVRLDRRQFMRPAFAVGVQGVQAGARPQYYAVASKVVSASPAGGRVGGAGRDVLHLVKVHGGALVDRDATVLALAGASLEYGHLLVQAEGALGQRRDRISLGVGYQQGRWTGMVAAASIHDAPDTVTVAIGYTMP